VARKQRARQEGARNKIPFKGMPLVIQFLHPGSASYHLSTITSNFVSILA
jgi:hypothetical protein